LIVLVYLFPFGYLDVARLRKYLGTKTIVGLAQANDFVFCRICRLCSAVSFLGLLGSLRRPIRLAALAESFLGPVNAYQSAPYLTYLVKGRKIVENGIGSLREGGRHLITLDGYCSCNLKSKFDKDVMNNPN
jgi:hypothetical protein